MIGVVVVVVCWCYGFGSLPKLRRFAFETGSSKIKNSTFEISLS